MSFDQSILDSAVEERTPWLIDVVTVITHSGGTVAAWIVSTVLTVALLLQDRRREAVLVAGAMLSGLAVMTALKNLFERQRPPLPDRLVEISSFSFPSGHAMMTAILASVLVAVILRIVLVRHVRITLVFLMVLYTLAVGLSRVYLGAHWMTDVLAGWAFGALWAAFWILLTRARPRHSQA
ncbi:phosphatase PAP2 family protein [Rhodococcus sp. NCIMB 12038]|uniref:phosphatase PAP2 family protein n=1 Tax=Rhodococcus sp. NCIMB 12038 TaxID=933800 RepID=UPI000B3D0495|nr:phosphatase PAP2 family protein [Rhodococcus sp. NCIMB 12038]OUS94786.1 phosphatase PAP2 family protein [Rhodococcus sp. NCIMB 12038]